MWFDEYLKFHNQHVSSERGSVGSGVRVSSAVQAVGHGEVAVPGNASSGTVQRPAPTQSLPVLPQDVLDAKQQRLHLRLRVLQAQQHHQGGAVTGASQRHPYWHFQPFQQAYGHTELPAWQKGRYIRYLTFHI